MSRNTKNQPTSDQSLHWQLPEERSADYWNNPSKMQERGQEFLNKPLEWLDSLPDLESSRRGFLKTLGAATALAAMSCGRRPVHKILPYVNQPKESTPGVPIYYASTCGECSAGCGLLVKNREGRPIKLEGNPDSPINAGKTCVRGQASLLDLYDPDRLRAPVLEGTPFSWDVDSADPKMQFKRIYEKVDSVVGEALNQARSVRILSRPLSSPSLNRLTKDFLGAFAQGKFVEWDPLSSDERGEAQALCYGKAVIPALYLVLVRTN